MPTATSSRPSVGYWLVFKPSQDYELRVKSVEVSPDFSPKPEDIFLFVDETTSEITGVRRLYQEWRLGEYRVFSFDRSANFERCVPLSVATDDLFATSEVGVFREISKTAFENIRSRGVYNSPRFLEYPDAKDKDWQKHVRELLDRAVRLDLLGPANGPNEEIVGMSVRDRYLVGKIAPFTKNEGEEEEYEASLFEEDEQTQDDDNLVPAANKEHNKLDLPGSSPDDEREDSAIDLTAHRSLIPSSFGLTFCIGAEVEEIEVQTNWGRYDRRLSEFAFDAKSGKAKYCWKRLPSGGVLRVPLPRVGQKLKSYQADPEVENVFLEGSISEEVAPREGGEGVRLVTLFLVNKQKAEKTNAEKNWLFQPQIIVRSPSGDAIFKRRPFSNIEVNAVDTELQTLETIYRKNVEFAVGHGVAVHATKPNDDSPEATTEIRTVVMPSYELSVTETPGSEVQDRATLRELFKDRSFDMSKLGGNPRESVLETLDKLVDDYGKWIETKEASILTPEFALYREGAIQTLQRCRANHKLLEEGVRTLREDQNAWDAFQFANRVMAAQRVRYQFATRRNKDGRFEDYDVSQNRSWRPFQLAFILLTIPSLANPLDPERSDFERARADLLWFPTGGGKTEAYMGVAAFTMAIRRLQGDLGGLDASRGLSVIMRYTLRLLTLQQFQRASTLICAMERERVADSKKWGETPFTLGLWVGNKTTPNTTKDSSDAIKMEKDNKSYSVSASPAQLQRCPWCGEEICSGRDIEIDDLTLRTKIYCGDGRGQCPFSRGKSKLGLPVVVVDDEIYRRPPSMLIATVDKFAQLAWKGEARTLFGKAKQECLRHGLMSKTPGCTGNHNAKSDDYPAIKVKSIKAIRPPDLIIQDEFHLIGGALGTTVGLYESVIDELCSWNWNGRKVRPKIIASTATTRKAEDQTMKVFWRKVNIFPPSGTEIKDNYFSVQRTERSGRRYVGVCAPGASRPAVMIRLYVAILTAAQSLFNKFGALADPYMTLVGYFNSLRELGGMRRLAEDDVQTRSYRVSLDAEVSRPGLSQRKVRGVDELTSRVGSRDIPKKLARLEQEFKAIKGEREHQGGLDVILATNMLSVGVDVTRLGVMVVNGQPKNTAEYIQATSRVGRAYPGLVFTALNWSRPRDFSHYESFEHFHASFYKFVEAQSATPFATRALDRCLTGALVSLARVGVDELNANGDAERLDDPSVRAKVEELADAIAQRARAVTSEAAEEFVCKTIEQRLNLWEQQAKYPGRKLGYEQLKNQGETANLIKRPSAKRWDELTVALSMREVEPELTVVSSKPTTSIDLSQPAWEYPKQKTDVQMPKEGEEE